MPAFKHPRPAARPAKLQSPGPEARRKLDAVGIDWFLDRYVGGKSLKHIAEELKIPSPASVLAWIEEDPERDARYQRAREEYAESIASEIIALADEPPPVTPFGNIDSAAVQDKRLRIDARKWVAAKLRPRVYGDRLDVTSGGNPIAQMTDEQIDARLMMLLGKVGGEVKDKVPLLSLAREQESATNPASDERILHEVAGSAQEPAEKGRR